MLFYLGWSLLNEVLLVFSNLNARKVKGYEISFAPVLEPSWPSPSNIEIAYSLLLTTEYFSLCTGFLNRIHFSSANQVLSVKTYEPAFWQQLIFKLDTTCSSNKYSNYTLSELAHKCILEYATKCTNTFHQKSNSTFRRGNIESMQNYEWQAC